MNPAAPVTRMRIGASLVTPLVLLVLVFALSLPFPVLFRRVGGREAAFHIVERVVDLVPVRLEPASLVEVRARLRAAAELQEREAEVVVRVALDRVGGTSTAQAAHGASQEW